MTVEDLADLMELHAKMGLARDFAKYTNGHKPHIKGDIMRPWFPDEDNYSSAEAYQEELEAAERHNTWLAEHPSAVLTVMFYGWHPTGGHAGINYAMSLSEAEEYGESLNDVLSMRLMDALEDLQNLQPAGA